MEHLNDSLQQILKTDDDPFHFAGLKYIETAEESRALAESEEPCVIISASGTADSGRVKHHLFTSIENSKNTILFVGFCQPQSIGGKLIKGDHMIELFNEHLEVRASIEVLGSMSAHGDSDDLLNYIACQDCNAVKKIFLVHGEEECQALFAEKLVRKGYSEIIIPTMHASFQLN